MRYGIYQHDYVNHLRNEVEFLTATNRGLTTQLFTSNGLPAPFMPVESMKPIPPMGRKSFRRVRSELERSELPETK